MAFIEVRNLRKVYRLGNEKVYALKNIDLEISKGEVCCILGTSGSGKSTLLNMLAGLEKPTRGDIFINGTNIAKLNEKKLARFRQENTGFVFQSYNLIPQLTALENVGMPLMFKGVPKRIRNKRALAMLKAVGLGERMKHRPSQMSGGQQQRVGIARAFVAKPNVIFADEPTGNLDTKTTEDVMSLMVEMCRKHNLTLILVTHDLEIAGYADRIVHIIDGEITSIEENTPVYIPEEKTTDNETKEREDNKE
ncbi:MAG: ABC transporter ATP-binding protein [Ruminiclostridium sp.]|nr:ABC transporter ATP-binding protein [Ruminiclostridium sp.]